MTVRILVVEDDAMLADAIARGLRQVGMAVDLARDGADALEKAAVNSYDVVVLDRHIPVIHGDEVCRRLVASPDAAPILMLTSSGTVADRVAGLAIGADDYLSKPFATPELIARLHALHRRGRGVNPPVLHRGDLVVEPAKRIASRSGRSLNLTRKEFGVLEVLLTADGQVVSAEELLEHVWDEHTNPFTNVVRVTMMTLRRKIGDPPVIETVIGVGYRIL